MLFTRLTWRCIFISQEGTWWSHILAIIKQSKTILTFAVDEENVCVIYTFKKTFKKNSIIKSDISIKTPTQIGLRSTNVPLNLLATPLRVSIHLYNTELSMYREKMNRSSVYDVYKMRLGAFIANRPSEMKKASEEKWTPLV